jgi:hypothetical protein
MKTTPHRFQVLQGLGALQIFAALGLGIAVLYSHRAYKESVAPVLPKATASLSATADVVSQVATEVHENQAILDNLATALDSYGALAAQSKASAQEMIDLLPAWDKSVTDIARRTKDASRLMKATADKMEFHVPTGIEFEGFKPRISWSVPLGSQAQDLRTLASKTQDLSVNIDRSWATLSTNATAMSRVFLNTCDTTSRLLAGTKDAVSKLRKEDLGPAVDRLNDASTGLKAVAQGINHAGIFVDSLFYLGLALAASVGISGLSTLLLAGRTVAPQPP